MQEYSIFKDTIADMTYPEVEEAVRDGAVALWALGVIEQHGPHLPLATDVYVPMARLRRARQVLAERGITGPHRPGVLLGREPRHRALPRDVPPAPGDHGRGHARHVPQPR